MKRKFSKKSVALLVSLVLVLGAAVGGTIAWMFDQTDPVINKFTVGDVTTSVDETIDGQVKKDVRIQNTGTVPAYIRATVVVTWQDEDGNVYGKAPVAGTDYTIQFSADGWTQAADDFYYWTEPVAPGEYTGVLITECKPLVDPPADGYGLNVEIIGSGIQAMPDDAIKEAWGVDPVDWNTEGGGER